MSEPTVLLATCAEVPDLDDDARLLQQALRERGVAARPAVWTDDSEQWAAADLVVVRTTWDYALQRERYLAWAEQVASVTRLENPPDLLAWSSDKRYLHDLAALGLPVVPSHVVEVGTTTDHPYLGVEHVVKPTVSAGSRDTYRVEPFDHGRSRAAVRTIQRSGRAALVQPYLAGVDAVGETALLHADGRFSHAMRKDALLRPGHDAADVDGLFLAETMSVREPGADELAVAERVMAAVADRLGRPPLYARVDLLPSDQGPLVLELELVEPSLFLDHVPSAAATFADAVVGRLRA